MTYPTEITLAFADGRYRFFSTLALLIEFEKNHGSICMVEPQLRMGIGLDENGKAIFNGESAAFAPACRDLIRLALIGGNKGIVDGEEVKVGPIRAMELVDLYVFPARPLAEAAALAWQIASVMIYGNELGAKLADAIGADAEAAPETEANSESAEERGLE